MREGLREISRERVRIMSKGDAGFIHGAKQAEQRPIHLIHLRSQDTGLSSCMQLVYQVIPFGQRLTRICHKAPQPCLGSLDNRPGRRPTTLVQAIGPLAECADDVREGQVHVVVEPCGTCMGAAVGARLANRSACSTTATHGRLFTRVPQRLPCPSHVGAHCPLPWHEKRS